MSVEYLHHEPPPVLSPEEYGVQPPFASDDAHRARRPSVGKLPVIIPGDVFEAQMWREIRQGSMSKFGAVWFEDITLDVSEEEWLAEDFLPQTGLSIAWGDPSAGKSFLAIDLAMAVATGRQWFGSTCLSGGVIYLAAEDPKGIAKRLAGYRLKHVVPENVPFVLLRKGADLCTDSHNTAELIEEIEQHRSYMSTPLRLVIVDTLNRVMAGGNENDPRDMGALIRNCERIREAFQVQVLIIHHGGKDQSQKARGHSSLLGAVDTAIEVTRPERSKVRTARIRKQKNGEDGLEVTFTLEEVCLGLTATGKEITTCIVCPSADDDAPSQLPSVGKRKVSGVKAVALDALRKAIADHGTAPLADNHIPSAVRCVSPDLWRNYFYQVHNAGNQEAKKKAFQRAQTDLQVAGEVAAWGDSVWLAH